ncbi:MAG: DDE-type integrase/transposase/recombinase, partial [Actinomycetota bacterium]|nr:DDE-type integrase/transposase/recombinase [Actinomycetota bacterium]
HAERIDVATKVAISADGPIGRSFIESLLEGRTEFSAPPLYEPPISAATMSVVVATESGVDVGDLPEYQLRLALVRTKVAEPSLTWRQLGERFGVTARKARYFWREFELGGEAELRPRQRKRSGPRVCPEVLEVVGRLWKNSRKLSVRQIYEHPELRARRKELEARGLHARLSYDQLLRYVRAALRPNREFAAMRSGARRLPPPLASGVVDHTKSIERPLQVVQVDSTWADVQLRTSDGEHVIERPRLLFAVDVASRCFAGWRLCLGDPEEVDYLKLMAMVFEPKEAVLRSIGVHNVEYPVYGIPERVIADRGWIFSAQSSRERLNEIGVAVEHAAPYMPQMKGIVERLFGTINQRFIHRLPGTTKQSPQARGHRDSVLDARMTVNAFERYLAQMIVDGYSDELRHDLRATPLERWDKLVERHGVRRWPTDSASQLRLQLFRLKSGDVRTRDPRGYLFRNEWYRPESADAPSKAQILYDPDDLRWVVLLAADGPMAGSFVCRATARDLDPALPISERMLREQQRPQPQTRPRHGSELITDVLAEAERGAKLSQRQATVFEKSLRVLEGGPEHRADNDRVDVAADIEDIELPPQKDFVE